MTGRKRRRVKLSRNQKRSGREAQSDGDADDPATERTATVATPACAGGEPRENAVADDALQDRIRQAQSPAEAAQWQALRERNALLEEHRKDRQHRRRLVAFQTYTDGLLPIFVMLVGILLVILDYHYVGFMFVGAGLWTVAPKFVERMTDAIRRNGAD